MHFYLKVWKFIIASKLNDIKWKLFLKIKKYIRALKIESNQKERKQTILVHQSGTKHFYWVLLYGIRSFLASFHHFLWYFYVREMTTKASSRVFPLFHKIGNVVNFVLLRSEG